MRKILSRPHIALGPNLIPSIRLFSAVPSLASNGDRHLQDIVPGDLKATLEAHRASNRAPPIRRVVVDLVAATPIEYSWSVPTPLSDDEASSTQDPITTDHGSTELEDGSGTTTQRQFQIHRSFSGLEYILPYGISGEKRAHIQRLFTSMKHRSAHNARLLPSVNPARHRHGKNVDLGRYGGRVTRFRPWEDEASQSQTGGLEKLSLEVKNLANWMTLTPVEEEFRRDLTRAFIKAMMESDDDIDLWTFGSIDTGLASTMSDIDIGFRIRSIQKAEGQRGQSTGMGNPQVRKKISRKLDKLCIHSLAQAKFADHETVWARHPLLRMRHIASNVELQIVCSTPRPAVVEIIRNYLDEYPQLKPIYFCVKSALAARGLDEPRLGGVGSYGLLMMIVAAFKLNFLSRQASLGKALQTVLDFYTKFQTGVRGLSIEPSTTFKKRFSFMVSGNETKEKMREDPILWARHRLSVCNEHMPYLLCLQDPADPSNDLGRSTYRILDIKETFRNLRDKLQAWLDSDSPNKNSISPLGFLLGGSLQKVRDRRILFEKWAISEEGRHELEINRKESVAANSMAVAQISHSAKFDGGRQLSVAEAMGVSIVSQNIGLPTHNTPANLEEPENSAFSDVHEDWLETPVRDEGHDGPGRGWEFSQLNDDPLDTEIDDETQKTQDDIKSSSGVV